MDGCVLRKNRQFPISLHWCSLLWNLQTAAASVNEPLLLIFKQTETNLNYLHDNSLKGFSFNRLVLIGPLINCPKIKSIFELESCSGTSGHFDTRELRFESCRQQILWQCIRYLFCQKGVRRRHRPSITHWISMSFRNQSSILILQVRNVKQFEKLIEEKDFVAVFWWVK